MDHQCPFTCYCICDVLDKFIFYKWEALISLICKNVRKLCLVLLCSVCKVNKLYLFTASDAEETLQAMGDL